MFGERFADAASPRRYVELVDETQPGNAPEAMRQVTMREGPDVRREMSETAFLALRLRKGLDIAAWEARFGVDIMDVFGDAIEETQSIGLTELVDGRLRLRDEAVLVGDEAFLRFLEPAVSSNMI
jgi:oxygen-independent coproporphyrinogen-3 oxidase